MKNALGAEFSRLLHTPEWSGRREELRAVLNDALHGMFNKETGSTVVYLLDFRQMDERTEARVMQALPWAGKAGGCPPFMKQFADEKDIRRDPTEDTEPDR